MSQAPHPKAEIIKQALLEMRPLKEIRDVADCRQRDVYRQIETFGFRRIYLTRAERELIAHHRGLDLQFVP
jgi:hypothetical protein